MSEMSEGDGMGGVGMNSAGGAKLPVVICPGFHESALTEGFVRSLRSFVNPDVAKQVTPTDPFALHRWLTQALAGLERPAEWPLVGIGFSAGVVGLAGALLMWQQQGNQVAQLIAIDGWGMPLVGLPVCRMSHDRFTHMTSLPLGAGNVNFYADPAVDHLQLWEMPEKVQGWQMQGWQSSQGVPMTAAEFLRLSLHVAWNEAFSWRMGAGVV